MMVIKNLIFDFDGTIANTFEKAFEIYNDLSKKYKYLPLKKDKVHSNTLLSARELIRYSKMNLFRLPQVLTDAQRLMAESIHAMKPIEGIVEVLKEFSRHYFMAIVTSNHKDNVMHFLKNHNLNIFHEIISARSLFGKHMHILRLAKKHNLNREESVYIGDETRDVEAAKKSKIKMIAVSWGYNRTPLLETMHPEYLVHSPKELLSLLRTPSLLKKTLQPKDPKKFKKSIKPKRFFAKKH